MWFCLYSVEGRSFQASLVKARTEDSSDRTAHIPVFSGIYCIAPFGVSSVDSTYASVLYVSTEQDEPVDDESVDDRDFFDHFPAWNEAGYDNVVLKRTNFVCLRISGLLNVKWDT